MCGGEPLKVTEQDFREVLFTILNKLILIAFISIVCGLHPKQNGHVIFIHVVPL